MKFSTMDTIALIGFALMGALGAIVVFLPVIIINYGVASGNVTSVSHNSNFIMVTTTVNFQDGSTLHLWGNQNIPLGIGTIRYHSSYLDINTLDSWS